MAQFKQMEMEERYPVGVIDEYDWKIADFQFWLNGNDPFTRR